MVDCEKAQFEPSFDILHNLINMEFHSIINEYTSFLASRSPYEEIQKYFNENSYSHEIGDIIINPKMPVLPSYRSQSIDWLLYGGNTGI